MGGPNDDSLKNLPQRQGVRRIFFKKIEDLPVLLSAAPMRADAPVFVPRSMEAKAEPEQEDNGEQEESTIDQPDADFAGLVDSRTIEDSLKSTAAPLAVEVISDEEKEVARRFLAGYNRVLRNRKLEKKKGPVQQTCDSYFMTCLKQAEEMEWREGSFYKKLFLGLVPHLLTCINVVDSYSAGAKKAAKKRLMDNKQRQDMDALNKRMTEIK